MLFSSVLTIVIVSLHLSLVCFRYGACQFPSVCNTPENLASKTCCPNDCSSSLGRGACMSVVYNATAQANRANTTITEILKNTHMSRKGAVDSRYKWPTKVFEKVCQCYDNYYGANCSECAFGWTGNNCETCKEPVFRKSFSNLSDSEKQDVITGFRMLKSEMGYWSVIVAEPTSTSGQVTLQNVSTYDYLIYVHNYVTRDGSAACRQINGRNLIDFAHSGPNFPVWHRTYLLILERAMQRVLNNERFGLPYWSWETNDRSPFTREYFGSIPSNGGGFEDLSGNLFDNWKTICDVAYRNSMMYRSDNRPEICAMFWRVCNPKSYLSMSENNRLQRGNNEPYYLPGVREIQIAIAAPNYDSPPYNKDSSDSFRNRMEGWNKICSGEEACIGPQENNEWRLHNVVHFWVGGHMRNPPSTVNDPIFSLHHANIDRILESWLSRFSRQMIPEYVPENGGHPGHNKDDYMVPFFPLITPGEQYSLAKNWGYKYDYLFNDNIKEADIKQTFPLKLTSQCFICTAENSCVCRRENNMPGFEICANCSPNTTCPIDSNPTRSSSSKLEATYLFCLLILLFWYQVLPF